MILDGVDDVPRARGGVSTAHPRTTDRTHVAGVSEGGLVATLLAERSPELFSSALAACGPIGSFRQQINYLGDFRVLFDYYFPGVLPGSAVTMPPLRASSSTSRTWASIYVPGPERAALRRIRPRRSS